MVWLTLGRIEESTAVPWSIRWSQPEIVLWWDGIQLDSREDWNEDWAIVDGAGYFDCQEMPDTGDLAFVESNKLTVRYHKVSITVIDLLKASFAGETPRQPEDDGPVFVWSQKGHTKDDWRSRAFRAPVLPDLRSGNNKKACIIKFEPGFFLTNTSSTT